MLALFDIDGTLLAGALAAHAQALRRALHEVYGVGDREGDPSALPRVPAAGRTDLEIARETLLLCGRSARVIDDGLADLREICVREYARCAPQDLSDCVVAGMGELLAEISQIDRIKLALLSGNLEPIARSKLTRAGIGHHFPCGQGAFGSDSEDRTELPAIARRRAALGERPHPRSRTLVIGDTPRDIACARDDGVRCLAVTTGPYRASELAAADAVAVNSKHLRELLLAELERIDRAPPRVREAADRLGRS
jgi:phosphoglycolate phosphatase-like HAD superfamily hydrolase